MAISKRQIAEDSEKILESFMNEDVGVPVNEELNSSKMVDLNQIQEYISKKTLSYYGSREFRTAGGDVDVSIFLMSTKSVSVPEGNNVIDLGYSFNLDRETITVQSGRMSAALEDFIGLPIANHGDDKISSDDIVKLCDTSQIYNLYQDIALTTIRKYFTYAYHMFTGANMYKVEERIIYTQNGPQPNTLYVTYDTIRKKFKYSYNSEFILKCAIEEWVLQKKSYKSLEDCYEYILAFLITHEMMHIIHHNTISAGDNTGGPEHIGIVTAVAKNNFIVTTNSCLFI